jgi:Uncharacterized protein conserved in bacteria (DUF2252)
MSSKLSFEINAPEKAIDRIHNQSDQERSQFIIDVFVEYFGDGIKKNPQAFSGRFRKMASTPFNFYRGSALLFYQDLKVDQDQWIQNNQAAGHIFIHVIHFISFIFPSSLSCYYRAICMQKILEPI